MQLCITTWMQGDDQAFQHKELFLEQRLPLYHYLLAFKMQKNFLYEEGKMSF